MADVTDDFNRANGSLGLNWVDSPTLTGLSITSNKAGTAVAAWSLAYWNPATNTVANDQHSQIAVGAGFCGAIVRHQIGALSNAYIAFAFAPSGTAQVLIYRIDSGSFNLLATGSPFVLATGDILALTVTGSNLVATVNSVTQATATDATYTAGSPGIAANNGNLDDWAAGPIFGTTTLMGAMWQ